MSDYFSRPCQYSLVELSLLARLYEDFCAKKPEESSVSMTLLKMKATEKSGKIKVLFHIDTPIGFHWSNGGEEVICIHPVHEGPEAKSCLLEA